MLYKGCSFCSASRLLIPASSPLDALYQKHGLNAFQSLLSGLDAKPDSLANPLATTLARGKRKVRVETDFHSRADKVCLDQLTGIGL
jgi:hypothetical protein